MEPLTADELRELGRILREYAQGQKKLKADPAYTDRLFKLATKLQWLEVKAGNAE